MRFSCMNLSIPPPLRPTSTVLVLFLAAPFWFPPPTSTPTSWRDAFFFPERSKSCHSTDFFFFPLPAGLKKRKNLLDCLCLTASLIPTKEEEEEKKGKDISFTVGKTDLRQVKDPLVKIMAVEGSGERSAGNRWWCNLWLTNFYDREISVKPQETTSGQL